MIDGLCFFFFSRRRRHTRYWRDWSSDVCSSDLGPPVPGDRANGEINTIKGNRNRMRAREAKLDTELFDGPAGPASELGLERIFPVTASDFSDSATFDEVLELLHLSGRSLPHAEIGRAHV